MANAVLWRELDAAIGRHTRVEFDCAKAHGGVLLNECADQLATRGVKGTSNFPGEIPKTPAEEIESEEEFVMNDEDVTREADWDEFEHIAPGTVRVRSLGLAEEEERYNQEEVLKRFAHDFLGASSDSPKASTSEDEGDLPPELGDDSAVQAFAGNGFQVVQDESAPIPTTWSGHAAKEARGSSERGSDSDMNVNG
jgi:hypothetical protein